MSKVPLFVELCAGTAALSLRLESPEAKPPIARMGNKAGYADAILKVLGLKPGQGAHHYLWCEPDAGCRLLLHAYRDRELCAAAADVLRGWHGEPSRALWDRLKSEGEFGDTPIDDPREVARFMWVMGRTFNVSPHSVGFIPEESNAGQKVWGAHAPAKFAERLEAAPTVAGHAEVQPDARTVDPRDVARWILLRLRAWRFDWHTVAEMAAFPALPKDGRADEKQLSERTAKLPTLPSIISGSAENVEPPEQLPPGTICYMDPPYVDTIGYNDDLARERVVELALKWQKAGATVCISEAEPLPALMAQGWHSREITFHRKGMRRIWSKQQREFLTMSSPGRHPGRPRTSVLGKKKGSVL